MLKTGKRGARFWAGPKKQLEASSSARECRMLAKMVCRHFTICKVLFAFRSTLLLTQKCRVAMQHWFDS